MTSLETRTCALQRIVVGVEDGLVNIGSTSNYTLNSVDGLVRGVYFLLGRVMFGISRPRTVLTNLESLALAAIKDTAKSFECPSNGVCNIALDLAVAGDECACAFQTAYDIGQEVIDLVYH